MQLELTEVTFTTAEGTFLNETSVIIEEGSTVLVLGPSGAGKTLSMKIMAGILPNTAGSIKVDGRLRSQMSDREVKLTSIRQGFAFQDAALWQNMTLRQNLSLSTQFHFPKRPPTQIEERINYLVRRLGFRESLDQRPARLSGGNRTIVSVMRALMLDPELVFLDEPSTGLDSEARERLLDLLKDLKRQGKTLVIASHDREIASMLADWVLIIEDGHVLMYDTVQSLVATDNVRVREIARDMLDLTSSYDADILDILGGADDDPFS